jgi:hypothetical protein
MTESRFPSYDVLSKRNSPSWDQVTRRVVDLRLAVSREPDFFTPAEWTTADAICNRILPQPAGRPPVPLGALLDAKLKADSGDGFREADMPYMPQAWRQGLAATEVESRNRHAGRSFAALHAAKQDALLGMMQRGELSDAAWTGLGARNFFLKRLLVDVPGLYYSHPTAWSEIGFGGPASPRGYVRMEVDRRDPWEAVEAGTADPAAVVRENKRVG